jgi:O-antigen ligase
MLVLYGAASWLRSSSPEFSRAEWMRLGCGAVLFFVVAAQYHRKQIERIVDVLIGVAILTSIAGLAAAGEADASGLCYPFGNAQLQAGFLMILSPLLVVLAFGEQHVLRRAAAQGAATFSLTALGMTGTRSAWLGLLVALLLLLLMAARSTPGAPALGPRWARRKHELIVPAVILVTALGLSLSISEMAPVLRHRAGTLMAGARDGDLQWRLGMWRRGWKLLREQPLWGWGIGTFPVEQARVASGGVPRELVERAGPSLAEEAHNEYVQTAAEMGIVGLCLYLWVPGAFLVGGWRLLRGREAGLRQRVLMGCLAGVAGQAVDALANPAWRFAEVSLLFWVLIGLGVAAASRRRDSQPEMSAAPSPEPVSRCPPRLGWQVAALAFTLTGLGAAWAERGVSPLPLYNGEVQLTLEPHTITLSPGQCVQFHAFADTNHLGPIDVSSSAQARFFTRLGESQCLSSEAVMSDKGRFCAPQAACDQPGCGGHVVPVFVTYGQPPITATARVVITCPAVHDVAIARLDVPPVVSRNMDAEVQVTIANRGTQAEQTELLLRVQPGRIVIVDDNEMLAAGETKTLTFIWPTPLMGEDGPKSLVAQLFLKGATDATPADNQAIQLVTVGP